MIAAARLRGGNAASARGAASLAAEAIAHRAGLRLHRHDRRPGGLGLLHRRGDRRGPPRRRPVLRHRRWTRASAPRSPPSREVAWTADPVPARDLGRPAGLLDLRRRGRRDRYTAFASKKGQAVTARLIVRRVRDLNNRPRRAGRAVPRLALPRRLHRLPVRPGPGRGAAPRPRRSSSRSSPTSPTARWLTCPPGSSPRTPPGWPAPPSHTTCCAPPAPWPACPSRKARGATHPPRPDRRRRPHRPARPRPHHPAPARRLAPRTRMAEPVRRRLRPARRSGLTSPEPVTAPARPPAATRTPPRTRNPRTSRRTGERQDTHARSSRVINTNGRRTQPPSNRPVESVWGAVPGLLLARLPRPLAEPGVPVSGHRALRGSCRVRRG